jgi:hypothetical protein
VDAGDGEYPAMPGVQLRCGSSFRGTDARPDLADPATIGCLLALVRAAYDDPTLVPHSDGKLWAVVIYDAVTGSEVTVSEEYGEGEALAVALLAKSDPRWLVPHGEFVRVRLVR